jgi:AraC-like DNA-binding protein
MSPRPPSPPNAGSATLPPSPVLRPYVRHFVVVDAPSPRDQLLLPDAGLAAPVRFAGTCTLPDGSAAPPAALSGLRGTARVIGHGPGYRAVVAVFTPTGAAAFTRAPLDELFGATAALGDVIGTAADARLLGQQVAEAPGDADRVAAYERYLIGRLRGRAGGAVDPLVSAAVAWITGVRAGVRVDELARRVGLSQSALERRFRRVVGAPPKALASIVRLRRVTRLRAAGMTFTAIAHAAGYADQSHFIKDFRRVTGVAPAAFFRGPGFC